MPPLTILIWISATSALTGSSVPRATHLVGPQCQILQDPATVETTRAVIREADAIMLAQALDTAPALGLARPDSVIATVVAGEGQSGAISFEISEVLRAPRADTALQTGRRVTFAGTLHPPTGWRTWESVPRLEGRGADECMAMGYEVGGMYLFLLRREAESGRFTPYGRPLRPTNEEIIDGENDPWLQWVRAELVHTNVDPPGL